MKALLLTLGTRGDVQPFVALGRELLDRGHDVTIATSRAFESLVTRHGSDYRPIGIDFTELAQTRLGRDVMGRPSPRNMLRVMREVRSKIRSALDDQWDAARDVRPDVIVYHAKALAGRHLSEKLSVPAVLNMLIPGYTPTTAFASIVSPWHSLPAWLNRMSYYPLPLVTASFASVVNRWRREALGLPSAGRFISDLKTADGRPMPTMCAFSPTVVPRPDDWPETTVVTGFLFLDEEDAWEPDERLLSFLEAGDSPVYIGFGSAVANEPERLADAAVGALRECGMRGVIASGLGGMKPAMSSDEVFVLRDVPHGWLFPRVAAVVHHGGAGTTAQGLRHGRPTIICPFAGDQRFWGDRVARLGAGPAPIPQKKLDSAVLAAAIRQTAELSIRQRSAEVAAAIQAEQGRARGADFIESVANTN